jgi:predicted dehydrogenase
MKIAVIGLGFMGSTHVKAWRSLPGAELLAVVSGDDAKLAGDLSGIQGNLGSAGEKMDFSRVRKYRTANEAIRDPDIEAVDICLPTDLHASVAIAALRAGKHVLVEKPLALDAETASAVIAEAEAAGRILMTGQVLRFIPAYRDTAALLGSRELGAVRAAIFRRRCAAPAWSKWLANPAQSGGGVFDLLIHDVDYCLHVFGNPRSVTATGYEDLARGIDWIAACFAYPDTPAVVVTGGWHHPKAYPFSMEFTVVSDRGTLEFSSAGRPLTLYRGDGSEQSLAQPEVDIFAEELKYFLECATAGRQPALCPPRQSAQAVLLARYMLESRKRNGEKIACRF